jgi:hypothetical protein
MAGLFVDDGLFWMAQQLVGDTTNGRAPTRLRLFVNDVTPNATFTIASLTEMSTRSYVAKTLAPTTDWTWVLDGTNHWTVGTLVKAWSFAAGTAITIYGWYYTDASNLRIMAAERFGTPYNLGTGAITWTLTIVEKFKLC